MILSFIAWLFPHWRCYNFLTYSVVIFSVIVWLFSHSVSTWTVGWYMPAGILDITGYNIEVIQMVASDCDSPEFRGHNFSISSITFYPPNSGSPLQVPGGFIIDPLSGVVSTGLSSYRPYTDGKFLVTVFVTDYHHPSTPSSSSALTVRDALR